MPVQSCRPVRSPNCTANNDRQNRVIRLPYRPTCQTSLQLAQLLIYMPYAQRLAPRFWGFESGYCSLKRLCLTLRCFPSIHAYIYTHIRLHRHIGRSTSSTHRHRCRVASRTRKSTRRDLLNRRFKMLKYRRVVAARESTQLPHPLDVSSFGPT